MQVIKAQFLNNYTKEFGGKEYNYFVEDGMEVKVGDELTVMTINGEGYVRVSETGLTADDIPPNVLPYMKKITADMQKKEEGN